MIGDPHALEIENLEEFDYLNEYFNNIGYYMDYLPIEKALILHGSQPTEIWTTAKNIELFDIYFHRIVF